MPPEFVEGFLFDILRQAQKTAISFLAMNESHYIIQQILNIFDCSKSHSDSFYKLLALKFTEEQNPAWIPL